MAAQPAFWKAYRSFTYSFGYDAQETSDHGFMVLGEWSDSTVGVGSTLLMKTDSSGTVQWAKSYVNTLEARASTLKKTNDNGYIMAGIIVTAGYDVLLIKTDSLGTVEWARSYGGSSYDTGWDILQTSDSGFILTGAYYTQHQNTLILRTDALGNLLWSKVLYKNYYTCGNSIVQTADSGFVIGGNAGYNSIDGFFLLKIDDAGNLQWEKYYSAIEPVVLLNISVTDDSGLILCGGTSSYNTGVDYDIFLTKTNSTGNITWSKTYGMPDDEWARAVIESPDRGFVFAGPKEFNINPYAFFAKTDSLGTIVWSKQLGDFSLRHEINTVALTSDSGYIFCGETRFYSPSYQVGVLLVKAEETGNTSCDDFNYMVTTTNAPFSSSTMGFSQMVPALTSDTVIFTVADSVVTFDICILSTIPEIKSTRLISFFPDPSQGNFILKSPERFQNACMLFYNTMGTYVFSVQLKNETEQHIHAEMLPAGLYFVEIRNGDKIYKDKIMIVKN